MSFMPHSTEDSPEGLPDALTSAPRYRIEGGHPLAGSIRVAAAKNAINKQLVASLLTDEPCIFSNLPRIREIDAILDMLSEIGTKYTWLSEDTLRVETPEIKSTVVGQRYSGFNRIPILLLSPLIHRAGEATVPTVGGDRIGARPVDFHLDGLRKMGARIEITSDSFRASSEMLRGVIVTLPFPSVGATENLIISATLAQGTTVIENAAVEPEILDTILFLQKMGALIAVETDRRILIEGVRRLRGATHRPITDRIEVVSFASAAVATGGRISIEGAQQEHMISFLNAVRKVGGGFDVDDHSITFYRETPQLRSLHLETHVHPGFMTDWQQPFVVMLTQANGISTVHETVYEDRFGYVDTLLKMGADIALTPTCLGNTPCRYLRRDHLHSCTIRGPSPLRSTDMTIPDLRAGFAYIIAALIADGTSTIDGTHYLERGYADVPGKLAAIGAQIELLS